MIQQMGPAFILHTDHSTYCFRTTEQGFLQHLYYGKRVDLTVGTAALIPQVRHLPGNAAALEGLSLEDMALELSSPGLGDLRESFLSLCTAQGDMLTDFRFVQAEILSDKPILEGLPSSYGSEDSCQTLWIKLADRRHPLELELLYTTFDSCDVIVRSARLTNLGQESVTIRRLMSTQVDLDRQDLVMTTFNGAWAREFEPTHTPCGPGTLLSGSRTGCSSNRANPFVILRDEGAGEEYGNCYGFHLLYSGDHTACACGNAYGGLRFLHGIQPDGFSWLL